MVFCVRIAWRWIEPVGRGEDRDVLIEFADEVLK